MRTLIRNQRPFYYALYQGVEEVIRDGMHTGEYTISYSEPILCAGNISAGNGESASELYGLSASDYDKLIVLADVNIPIDESSVLWLEHQVDSKYDYIVKRVARSLNSVTIAVKKVDVDE